MSHEFDSGLFFEKSAWHKLGLTLPGDSPARYSVAESLQLSGMNWQVSPEDAYVGGKLAAGYKAIVRSDNQNVLGFVTEKYECLQNAELFAWFQPFLDSKEIAFETCGALRGGSLVWVLAKIQRPDAVIRQGDAIAKYLSLISSHDGTMATHAVFTPTRIVCRNTMEMALRDKQTHMLKVRHSKGQKESLAAVREAINLMDQTFEATAAEYRKLAEFKISPADLRRYVKLVYDMPEDDSALTGQQKKKLERNIQLAISGAGNTGETAWDGLNGVTQYLSHEYGRTDESRLNSLVFGTGKTLNARALSLALQLAA